MNPYTGLICFNSDEIQEINYEKAYLIHCKFFAKPINDFMRYIMQREQQWDAKC